MKINLLIIAAILILLIRFVPALIQTRIKMLRWLKLESLADFHERNVNRLIPGARIGMGLIAALLLVLVLLT